MDRATEPVGPPSRLLLALEMRGIWELQAFFTTYPLLRRAPRGDGHPVLVLPGLAASDVSTRSLYEECHRRVNGQLVEDKTPLRIGSLRKPIVGRVYRLSSISDLRDNLDVSIPHHMPF